MAQLPGFVKAASIFLRIGYEQGDGLGGIQGRSTTDSYDIIRLKIPAYLCGLHYGFHRRILLNFIKNLIGNPGFCQHG